MVSKHKRNKYFTFSKSSATLKELFALVTLITFQIYVEIAG